MEAPSMDQLSMARLCVEYFSDTALWINDRKTPERVKEESQITKKSVGSFQSASHCFPAAARAGKAVHKTSPQLNQVEVIPAHMELLSEVPLFKTNNLMHTHMKRGRMVDARYVFDNMPKRDLVSWNTMILGYAKQDEGAFALQLYARMIKEGIQPNARTYVGVLKACGSIAAVEEGKHPGGKFVKIGWLEKGRAIHFHVLKCGFESDMFLGTTLVDVYAKCGSMEDALCVFDELADRDVVSWNTMILGYSKRGEGALALDTYARMQHEGVDPSARTFLGVSKACGTTAAVENGMDLHFEITKAGLENNINVASSLIDMYAKYGCMVDAQQLFDALPRRDVVLWTSLIAGYARQGESKLVFDLFERMWQEGIQPNGITFLNVLTVCSHAGLLDDGQIYFQAMSKQYGIIPTIEHYTCMVDLFGRAGQLEEAVAMIRNMSCQPDNILWLTLLGACQKLQNIEVGRHAFENVVKLDIKLDAAYVLMANIYADAQMQEDHDKIQVMRENARSW